MCFTLRPYITRLKNVRRTSVWWRNQYVSSLCASHNSRYFSVSKTDDRPETPRNCIRKIIYAFDPVENQSASSSRPYFSFLNPQAVANSPELRHANCIVPSSLKIPWVTSFPASLQSKYWTEAEEAARDLLRTIFVTPSRNVSEKYIKAVIDAAASFTVNVAPTGSLSRTRALARAYTLVFIHDDAVESGNFDATIPNTYNNNERGSHTGFDMVAQEVMSEDPVQGRRFLDAMISWGSFPQTKQPSKAFPTLMNYLKHRIEDVGAYPVFRSAGFASDISATDQDEQALERLSSLCAKHFALTNDLYSYAKEVIAEKENGEPLLNAVKVVEDLLNVSSSSAKSILRGVILDTERQMGEEYESLLNTKSTTATQLVYARGLIIAVAGNMFFSATSSRYARAVDGSRLV
ncbi:aristolochene synthase [Aspergillus udagawae]|uniref:Aristolochene synthase n=1 Tax=Aspergillus udagawae TaxID=91492 RepID=A0A8H3NDU6_9EURO|nr:aristolochene synthase [Aspergillus udagawae]GFG20376.1 aristolochene synthase [Aspergillus udagawae]